MQYKFPHINHIDAILPFIEGHDSFYINKKDNYTVITYFQLGNETFPDITEYKHTVLRECRGIAFDAEGNLISRPFHKFFNCGERIETTGITEMPVAVLEKLDGSMIRPLYFGDNWRLATKAGVTDVSMQAEVFVADKPKYFSFIDYCRMNAITPIFEWCSRKQRIVLDYKEDNLILLAMRHMFSGAYVSRAEMTDIANEFNIPLVNHAVFKNRIIRSIPNAQEWVENARGLDDAEGYVMVFRDGHMMKAKSEWYVTLHRAKELVGREKDVIKLILIEKLDDALPMLPDNDRKDVEDFAERFYVGITDTSRHLQSLYDKIISCDKPATRKEFAEIVNKLMDKYRPFMYKLYDGNKILEVMQQAILKNTGSRTNLEKVRWLFGDARYQGWSDKDEQ